MKSESETEFENLLSKSTPLPCSVDSMQLMFDAGVEQQKRKGCKSRNRLVATYVLAASLMFTTTMLSIWVYQLNDQNHQLMAKLDLQSEQGEETTDGSNSRISPSAEVANDSHVQVVDNSTLDRGHSEDGSLGPVGIETRSFAMDSAFEGLMLHGVSLRPEDEYRNPLPTRRIESDRATNVSTFSNLNLMQKVQADFFAP